jgi:hypothetical protein
MKPLLPAVMALFLCSIFSCTKTNNVSTTLRDTTTLVVKDTVWETTPKNPIVGLWVGKFLNNGQVDSFYYSYDIQANGNMISSAIGDNSSTDAASGPWQLNGTTFTATLTQLSATVTVVQAITATYDSTAGTLTGQWTITQGSWIPGTFSLTRVP